MSEEEYEEAPTATARPRRRRENRIAAMQFLYMWESNDREGEKDLILSFFESRENPREFYAFSDELIQGVLANKEAIDQRIQEVANNWKFDRIARVDLAILRMACYELLYRPDIPPIVTINEAVDLGKEFSNDDSKRFINGVLDRISSTLTRSLRDPSSES